MRERQRAGALQFGEQIKLYFVEQRAARQWIDNFDRFRLLARFEPMDGVEQEAIRTCGELLQRRRRIGARGEAMARERRECGRIGIDQAVGRAPATQPSPCPRAQGAGQVRIRLKQVMSGAGGGFRIGGDQAVEQGKVKFGVVDRVLGLGGSRPSQPDRGLGPGPARQLLEPRQTALRRAQDGTRGRP